MKSSRLNLEEARKRVQLKQFAKIRRWPERQLCSKAYQVRNGSLFPLFYNSIVRGDQPGLTDVSETTDREDRTP